MKTHHIDTEARMAYENDVKKRPVYHNESPRKTWDELGVIERSSWTVK